MPWAEPSSYAKETDHSPELPAGNDMTSEAQYVTDASATPLAVADTETLSCEAVAVHKPASLTTFTTMPATEMADAPGSNRASRICTSAFAGCPPVDPPFAGGGVDPSLGGVEVVGVGEAEARGVGGAVEPVDAGSETPGRGGS